MTGASTQNSYTTLQVFQEIKKDRSQTIQRLVSEIEKLELHSDSRSAELEVSEDGYVSGLDDVLSLLQGKDE